jgi:hypothetical protein
MDYLIDAVSKFQRGQHPKTILANVLTTLLLNAEPLVLMAFPAQKGFPFPEYFGSCGRLVGEEYVGPPLTLYYNAEFKVTIRTLKCHIVEIRHYLTIECFNFEGKSSTGEETARNGEFPWGE